MVNQRMGNKWGAKIGQFLLGVLLFFVGIQVGAARHLPVPPKIYISDFWNNRIIKIDDMNGKNYMSLGNKGNSSGQFFSPRGMAMDSKGRLYIADSDNNRVVRMDDMLGNGWITYGRQGKGIGEFWTPTNVTLDREGRIYVADFGNDRIVRMDDMKGSNWSSWGVHGAGLGQTAGPFAISVY